MRGPKLFPWEFQLFRQTDCRVAFSRRPNANTLCLSPMNSNSNLLTLSPESVEAIAEAVVRKLNAEKIPERGELTIEEAVRFTGHKSRNAFTRWCKLRHVSPISAGRYRRSRLIAAMG